MLFFVCFRGSHKSKHKSLPPPPTNDSVVSNSEAYNTYKSYKAYKSYNTYKAYSVGQCSTYYVHLCIPIQYYLDTST